MPYSSLTVHDRDEMLKTIGVASIDELFADIPAHLREKAHYGLGRALTELEVRRKMVALSSENNGAETSPSFLGAGSYDHYIPSVVGAIASRGEFATAYTPYQAEVSQGTLQVIYEFQSLVCRLTGMEMANASLYDGASALAEALLMAQAITKRDRFLVPRALSPYYRRVARTYLQGLPLKIDEIPFEDGITDLGKLREMLGPDVAAVVVAQPNFFGSIEDASAISALAHEHGALLVAVFNPISLGLLPPPGDYDADIAVAEGQPLGIASQFGGPGVGLFCCRKKYARLSPGRLVGITTDEQGREGFTLTLQTREQHIRREKATSNICSNQALCALMATIYLAATGPRGLHNVASQSYHKAHYAAAELHRTGLSPKFGAPFFHEFVIKSPESAEVSGAKLRSAGLIGGYDLGREYPELAGHMLLCCTEKRTRQEIDRLVQALS